MLFLGCPDIAFVCPDLFDILFLSVPEHFHRSRVGNLEEAIAVVEAANIHHEESLEAAVKALGDPNVILCPTVPRF